MNEKHMEKYIQIGLNICFYRGRRNQEEISEKAGISTVYLSRIENGHSNPSLNVLFNIAEALNVPIHKLFEFRE